MSEPTRLVHDEATSPALRALLDAGAREAPTPEALDRVELALLDVLGGGGGGGGGGGAPAKGVGALGKLAIGGAAALAIVTAATLAVVVATPREAPAPSAPAPPTLTSDPAPALEPAIPRGVDPPPIEPSAGRRRATPAVASDPPRDELAIVSEAQAQLASDPARALALSGEHLRDHPRGALAQEREIIAIDALLRLGRRGDAEARAAAFREAWPRGAALRRIDVLLARP